MTKIDSNENIKPLTGVAIANGTGAQEHIPCLPRLDHNGSIICNEPDQEVVDTKETFAEALLPAVGEKNKRRPKAGHNKIIEPNLLFLVSLSCHRQIVEKIFFFKSSQRQARHPGDDILL